MNRRRLIASLAALPFAGASADARPERYRVTLIGGAFDGKVFRAGVRAEMDEGWKTYWRMPGDSGIPPDFDWSQSANVKSLEVLYPTPQRFRDESGETIGFKDRVVFPVVVTAADETLPVKLVLNLFFAVCETVCIPATAQAGLELGFRSPRSRRTGRGCGLAGAGAGARGRCCARRAAGR